MKNYSKLPNHLLYTTDNCLLTVSFSIDDIAKNTTKFRPEHCVKSVRIRSFSGPYFPAFGLNTERYQVFLCIHPNAGKYGPEKLQI